MQELTYVSDQDLSTGNARVAAILAREIRRLSVDFEPQTRAAAQQKVEQALMSPLEILALHTGESNGIQRIGFADSDDVVLGRHERGWPTVTSVFVLNVKNHSLTTYPIPGGSKSDQLRVTDFIVSKGSLVHTSVFNHHLLTVNIGETPSLAINGWEELGYGLHPPNQVATNGDGTVDLMRFGDRFEVNDPRGGQSEFFDATHATNSFSLSPNGNSALIDTGLVIKKTSDQNIITAIDLFQRHGTRWIKVNNPIAATNSEWRVSAWSQDSQLAAITQVSKGVVVINVTSGTESVVPAQNVSYAAFNPNKECLAIGHDDGSIDVLTRDTTGSGAAPSFKADRHLSMIARMAGVVTGLAFSPSGRYLAGADSTGYLKLWRLGRVATQCGSAEGGLSSPSVPLCPLSAKELLDRGLGGVLKVRNTEISSEEHFACGDTAYVSTVVGSLQQSMR